MQYIFLFFLIIFFKISNDYVKKKNFIPNFSGEKHQVFIGEKKIPLSGGIFLFFSFLIIFFETNKILILHLFLMLIVGLSSDIKSKTNPFIRLICQALIILSFVIISKLEINYTRVIILDNFLIVSYFNVFFVSFCILVLINGSNFIDGLNGLVINYYLLINTILFILNIKHELNYDSNTMILIFLSLIFLLILNFQNKLYLGDSGSYILSFFFGYFLIFTYQSNQNISPFFFVLLLWYPCFEILFSIFRKFRLRKSPILPDNEHFHQLIFYYFDKRLQLKKKITNNFSSLVIIFFNILIFYLASLNIYYTSYQILLIIFNIFIYIFLYVRLLKFRLKD